MDNNETLSLSTEAFLTLSKQLSDRDVKYAKLEIQYDIEREKRQRLEAEVKEQQVMLETLRHENEMLKQQNVATELRNMYLTNYIMLSAERIKEFVAHLCDIDRWAFLRTFMLWVIPKELEASERELIEEAMAMPAIGNKGVTLNQPTFNGAMYDVHGNGEVQLGNDLQGGNDDGKEDK